MAGVRPDITDCFFKPDAQEPKPKAKLSSKDKEEEKELTVFTRRVKRKKEAFTLLMSEIVIMLGDLRIL